MKSVTLLELIIVMFIIGIITGMGFIQYGNYQETSHNKEARATLRTIVQAELVYGTETDGVYYASSNIADINTNLKLDLDNKTNRIWNYSTTVGAPGPNNYCAQATRNGADGRTWRMRNTEDDPQLKKTCP